MATIKPFRAVRPRVELARGVAALPYDVMDVDEARRMAEGNPNSFLHVSRPEIDLPEDTDVHDDLVYLQGGANLSDFLSRGVLFQDNKEMYYVYRQIMGELVQTGIVACSAVSDYQNGRIKKHELTRQDKEEDRVRHIDALNANDEPVFLTYRAVRGIDDLLLSVSAGSPEYDFTSDDNVRHTFWLIDDEGMIASLTGLFGDIPLLYVADGHHRSAAASQVRDLRLASNEMHDGTEEYNYFLTVIFPDHEMHIMPYNRAVRDLNHHDIAEFMARVGEKFEITPVSKPVKPQKRHIFGMYLSGKWYELVAREGAFDPSDPVTRLDVSILQENILSPILGIRNPRTDQRIHFVGGIRGLDELEKLVDSGDFEVAFSLYPTSINELMDLADSDKIMPPKSTWFEPKLRSGLFLHLLH